MAKSHADHQRTYRNSAKGKVTRSRPIEHARSVLTKLRRRSKRLGESCTLTAEGVLTFWEAPCGYCEAPPTSRHSMDRVDNTKGYTFDNVVPACLQCNATKSDRSESEIRQRIEVLEQSVVAHRMILKGIERHAEKKSLTL